MWRDRVNETRREKIKINAVKENNKNGQIEEIKEKRGKEKKD